MRPSRGQTVPTIKGSPKLEEWVEKDSQGHCGAAHPVLPHTPCWCTRLLCEQAASTPLYSLPRQWSASLAQPTEPAHALRPS